MARNKLGFHAHLTVVHIVRPIICVFCCAVTDNSSSDFEKLTFLEFLADRMWFTCSFLASTLPLRGYSTLDTLLRGKMSWDREVFFLGGVLIWLNW